MTEAEIEHLVDVLVHTIERTLAANRAEDPRPARREPTRGRELVGAALG